MRFFDPPGASLISELEKFRAGASVKTLGLAGLQGATTYAGVLAGMRASRAQGQEARRSAYLTAQDEQLNARQAQVSAEVEAGGLRQKLADALGQRAAAAGGSGVAGGVAGGVLDQNADNIVSRAMATERISRSNADIAASRHRINALSAIMKGDAAAREGEDAARAQLGSGLLSGLLSIGRLFLG